MGGFIKGLAVGMASFAAGFVVLVLLFPPEPITAPAIGVPAPASRSADDALPPPAVEPDLASDAEPAPQFQPEPMPAEAPAREPLEPQSAPIADETLARREASSSVATPQTAELGEETTTVSVLPAAVAPAPPAGSAPVTTRAPETPENAPAMASEAAPDAAEPAVLPTATEIEPPVALARDLSERAPESATPEGTAADEAGSGAQPDRADAAVSPRGQAQPGETPANPSASDFETAQAGTGIQPAEPVIPADTAVSPGRTDLDTLPAAPAGAQAPAVPLPPLPGLNRVVDGVTVGRLPSIGAPPEPAVEPAPRAEPQDDPDVPAWRRFAAAHENPGGLPIFAVILIDAPADPGAEAAILGLPFAVSVALDPADPDAPRRAAAYRAAGHEVAILGAGLPAGATPADLDVTFDDWLRALPQAVALVDPPEGGFQGDRALAQRLMPLLGRLGLGLVTLERGLNPAAQVARGAGIADATVFRLLDADGESAFTIRRYLDRSTFHAQQEGRVAVMGRAARPETGEGLLGWRFEGRAGQVSLAPVSAWLQDR